VPGKGDGGNGAEYGADDGNGGTALGNADTPGEENSASVGAGAGGGGIAGASE